MRPGSLPEIRISVASACPCRISGLFFSDRMPTVDTITTTIKTTTKAIAMYFLLLFIMIWLIVYRSVYSVGSSVRQGRFVFSVPAVLIERLRHPADGQ